MADHLRKGMLTKRFATIQPCTNDRHPLVMGTGGEWSSRGFPQDKPAIA
jgi:hypothetical protein